MLFMCRRTRDSQLQEAGHMVMADSWVSGPVCVCVEKEERFNIC